MNVTFWSFLLTPWRIALGLVFVIASAWMAVVTVRRSRSGKWHAAIECIRVVISIMLAFTLLKPELVRLTRKIEQPLIAVLCDASESMSTQDVAQGPSAIQRADWVQQQKNAMFWSPLEESYKVIVEDFSAPGKDEEDPGTDINVAIEAALNNYDNLRAVLLLSDGDWNKGKRPAWAATRLARNDTPVFTVTVGSDRYLPDLNLKAVSAPAYGLMDEHISIPFTIQSRLSHDVKTTITLHGSSGIEAAKDIVIPAMSLLQDSLMLNPRMEGTHRFTVKLPVQKGEVFSDNNTKAFLISLRKEILKVLVIDSTPRWEYRFLRNALARDPGVDVDCLLLHPGMEPGGGRDYIKAFPNTKEKLSKYDVVFLGDIGVGPGELKPDQLDMIKGLVEQQGSGLVFLPGRRGREHTLLSTSIGELMPVIIDETKPHGNSFRLESKVVLTARGRDHLLTMLASDPARNNAVWKNLPGTYWHEAVIKAKAGSNVLAVHATARNKHGRIPLLVTQDKGNGKVLFMGTDNAWRWRRGVEDTYHYRFWGQVVRWMAHQRHLAHQDGIRFFYSPESPQRGNRLFLHATVFDKSGYPLKEGTVYATITSEEGQTHRIELVAEPGGWGVFTGFFVPPEGGTYDAQIKCKEADRVVKTQIVVSSPKREKVGRPARSSVLREISDITHGKHGSTEDLPQMIADLKLLPELKPSEKRFRLWCHPLWAGAAILLLGVYWTGRKILGML